MVRVLAARKLLRGTRHLELVLRMLVGIIQRAIAGTVRPRAKSVEVLQRVCRGLLCWECVQVRRNLRCTHLLEEVSV